MNQLNDPELGGLVNGGGGSHNNNTASDGSPTKKIDVDLYERYRRKIGSVVEMTKGGDKEKIKEALHAHKDE